MLLYTKTVAPRPPKRRSRAGCIHCKEKKKKCNEQRPQCDRCQERNLECSYEPVKPRKRRRTSSSLLQTQDATLPPVYQNGQWPNQVGHIGQDEVETFAGNTLDQWEDDSVYSGATSELPYTPIEEVEEVGGGAFFSDSAPAVGTLTRTRSPYPDLAMIAPSPVASPLLEFNAPAFAEFTERRNRRALIDHFCNVLSHLIVFKEDTGNPFRQLVLPLSHKSSPILNTIFALSSAHLEYKGVVTEETSLEFHNRALQGLAHLIEQNEKSNREEVLGAIMLLVYYEVLVQRGNSIVNGHLRGAMTVMMTQSQDQSLASLFLERAFRFYDVITALSFGTSPISPTLPPVSPLSLPSASASSPLSSVDTLLGMAIDLWPIIHRLSHLPEAKKDLQTAEATGDTSKATVLRTELESTSQAIELALTNWTPVVPSISSIPSSSLPAFPDEFTTLGEGPFELDPTGDARMQSILNNAEAYRQAALVFLYRDIQDLARDCGKVQRHAKLALQACKLVVEWAGPMSALLWPLFVGACAAIEEADRALASATFGGIERRQGMTNILRAWEIVEEVWRRVDAGGDPSWRDICAEKGYQIVFG